MHKTLAIVLFLILAAAVHKTNANISFGACSLSCNENEHHAHDMLGVRAHGPPGKRGPVGQKGEHGFKGDHGRRGRPGQSCECPDYEELAGKLAALQAQLDELKGQVQRGPIGWIKASNNLYYKFFDEMVNYGTAKSKCASFGARLTAAGMRTAELRGEIKRILTNPLPDTWIGLDDLVSQGSYIWSDGVKSTTENTEWYPGDPDSTSQRCAAITGRYNGKVIDSECSNAKNYLCEYSP